MKKTLKVLLAVVITPIALFLILTLLLYCPPVQKWAVEKQKKEHAQQRNRCTPSSYISDEMIFFYLG